jgi:hypothetical protein
MTELNKYIDYVDNYSKALEALDQLKKSRGISNFIKMCEKNDTSGEIDILLNTHF